MKQQSTMEPRKPPIVLYNVAVMESPRQDRAPTGSSDADLDFIDSIHHASLHIVDTPENHNYLDETSTLSSAPHHVLYKSPHHSIAPTTATSGSAQKQKYRVLGTFSLVGILYFATCGGPVGSEPLMSAGGPLLGLVGVAIYITICQIPMSLMLTELSCAFPENGGFSVWAMTAFGPFWGFQVGYWSWVASILNNAIYPGIIYSTIAEAYSVEATSGVVEFFVKVAIAIVLAVPSYIGVRFVGMGSLVLLVAVLGIVVIFSTWGFVEGEGAWFRLSDVRSAEDVAPDGSSGIDWTLLIHTLFWSFDGIQLVSVIGGEVLNPARTYPRVIALTVLCAVFTYVLTWLAGISADKMPWLELEEDSLPDLAEAIGGATLHQFMIVSSVLSSIGLYACTLFFQSFLVQGMAQSRLLPGVLRKRSARFKTPQYALALTLLVTLALVGFDFESILNMTNAFSGMVQLVIVSTMLKLRKDFPYLPRPMKVPGNFVTLVIMLIPSIALFVFAIVSTLEDWKLALVVVGFAIPGLAFPSIRHRFAGGRLCS